MFNIKAGVAITYIFKTVHHVECILVVIINFVTGMYLKKSIRKGAKNFAGENIVIDISIGSNL